MILKKIVNRLRRKFFLTEQDIMISKWYANGGDYELRFNYDLNKDSFVIDLGGYQGQWSSDLFSRYQCHIVVFEPVSSFAHKIKERFNNNSNIEVLQYGLGASSRVETISICGTSSSIFGKSSNTEEIRLIDIKEWFDKRKIHSVQLMKINIEGGEYELLDRLIETGLIEVIENIQVQFHNILDNSVSQMERIQENFKKTHVLTYQYKFVWENWTKKK